ncbi:adenosylcobinamide-phosphate synthase CbiB [Thioalkalivibrio thiocyanoxidans]|uniref:adenosylcobinamide-phosphate synthase CbiB n=1 Tax=Thioalkalivibrio thiocyanoxidans TaxID=152475 RepID=UPI0003772ADA|nr:adenosylcobinamide-phosphate synthase CbiB [Thioalkalivibrio thiocyanoxidans]
MTTFALLVAALVLDRLLGDPRRGHPLAGFGTLAAGVERFAHADSVWRGGFWVLALVVPFGLAAWWLSRLPAGWLVELAVLWLALGGRGLEEHARRVADALRAGDLPGARQAVGMLVSRDTSELDASGVRAATAESVLENGNDAVFATVFWFLVAGAAGVVVYRLVNTLDAMWGYRTPRHARFGRVAARLDDILNWVPARLTSLAYALAGQTRTALRCWRDQGRRWKSPNAGPVMAAGAGALGVTLGGPARYAGGIEERPVLGAGAAPGPGTIDAALRLVDRALAIWLVAIATGVLILVFV